ncbi:MAG: tetratricopeptide repeat protein [Leptospiraceae bacterium]|nr:tetratricopeptide repeat protein [Leptospiraceae bacterium]MDW7976833.1 tetratricopeptide repeat protein [Leptospiraceae bacterium]
MKILFQIFVHLIVIFPLYTQSENIIYGKKAIATQNYNEAIKHFQKEIQKNPQRCEGYYYLGITYEKLNQKQKAVEYFVQATKTSCSPDLKEQAYWKAFNYYKFLQDWNNIYQVGKSFLSFKYNKEVEKYVNIAEQKKDKNSNEIQEKLNQAKEWEEQNEFRKAAYLYESLYDLNPKIEFLMKAGNLFKEANDIEESHRVFVKVIRYYPENWYANYQVGMYHYQKGDLEKSIEYLNKSQINIENKKSRNYYNLLLIRASVFMGLENFSKVEEILNHIDKLNFHFQKERNYEVLQAMLKLIKERVFTYVSFDERDEKVYLYRMMEAFYNKDYENLYNLFINDFYQYPNLPRWSRYINQFYLVLIMEFRNDRNRLQVLLNFLNNSNFEGIFKNEVGSVFWNEYNFYLTQPLTFLEKEFFKSQFHKELILALGFTKIENYTKAYEILIPIENQLNSFNEKNLFLFLKALSFLEARSYNEGYELLQKVISSNSDYKIILKELPLYQELISKDEKWQKLIETNTNILSL